MAIYEVYIPPSGEMTGEAAGNIRYVADRPSILALIFPFVWLLWHRLWFWLAVYVLVAFFLSALGATNLAVIGATLTFLPGLYIFLEGPNMITAKLELQGWRLAGLVEAGSEDTAAARWLDRFETGFEKAKPAGPQAPNPMSAVSAHRSASSGDRPEFGLFAEG